MAGYGLITEVESFCGCISLQHGAYIIAAIYFVLGICGFGLSVNQQVLICSEFHEWGLDIPCASPFYVSIIIAAIIEVIVSVLLVIGAAIKNRQILLPWIIWNSILVLLSVAFSIYVATVAFNVRLAGPESPPGFTAIIISLLTAVPTLYSVVVVYSFYRLQGDPDTESLKPLHAEENIKTKL
ncbi:uncharacterized protein [Anabrus simplex]|uniref:uncharacterized protein n=1 Tax=Anabrus simplex TaxID=316456 RepID=UPI0035A35B24